MAGAEHGGFVDHDDGAVVESGSTGLEFADEAGGRDCGYAGAVAEAVALRGISEGVDGVGLARAGVSSDNVDHAAGGGDRCHHFGLVRRRVSGEWRARLRGVRR